jgi:hypothetical protein
VFRFHKNLVVSIKYILSVGEMLTLQSTRTYRIGFDLFGGDLANFNLYLGEY